MMIAGFPREARLLSGGEFKRVFDARQVESNRYFRIHWAERPEREDQPAPCSSGPRLGLAIAKRVARRAVDRNRIRRIAREAFRQRRHLMRPVDFVVLARPPATEADSRTLKLALEQLWLRFESP
jgi:ribonuclease P protein component